MNTDDVKQDASQIQAEEPVTSTEEAPQAAGEVVEAPVEEVTEAPKEEPKTEVTEEEISENSVEETAEPEAAEEISEEQTPEEEKSETSEQIEPEIPSEEQQAEEAVEEQNPDIAEAETVQNDVPGSHWYVVHTYSGHENRVAAALKQRVESEHLEHKILDVLVPTQEKIEIRSGKKENVKEKIFPGYILVRMVLDDISWLAVRTTQGVTSFVGMSNKPTAIPDREVKSIVSYMTQGAQPTYKTTFSENDTVKIIDGPFAEFIGKVESVDKERGKIKVLVSIFSRETPVELDFLQVAKL